MPRPIRSPFFTKKQPDTREALMGVLEIQKLIAELQNLKEDHQAEHDQKMAEISRLIEDAKTHVTRHTERSTNELVKTTKHVIGYAQAMNKGDKGDKGEDGRHGVDGRDGRDGKDGRHGIDGKHGRDGQDGKNADPQEVTNYIKEKKLLSIDHINGLPERLRDIHNTARAGAMRGGGDTVVAGNGISITRDANGKSTITNTGSASNKVRDEVPSGSGTSFTLAHTPIANTLQLYRGGIRIQSGAGNDYTRSGTTITLATALATSEILLADYEY